MRRVSAPPSATRVATPEEREAETEAARRAAKIAARGLLGPAGELGARLAGGTLAPPGSEAQTGGEKVLETVTGIAGTLPAIVLSETTLGLKAAELAVRFGITSRVAKALIESGVGFGAVGALPTPGKPYTIESAGKDILVHTAEGAAFRVPGVLAAKLGGAMEMAKMSPEELEGIRRVLRGTAEPVEEVAERGLGAVRQGRLPTAEGIQSLEDLFFAKASQEPLPKLIGALGGATVAGGITAAQGGSKEDILIQAGVFGLLPYLRKADKSPKEQWDAFTKKVAETTQRGDWREMGSLARQIGEGKRETPVPEQPPAERIVPEAPQELVPTPPGMAVSLPAAKRIEIAQVKTAEAEAREAEAKAKIAEQQAAQAPEIAISPTRIETRPGTGVAPEAPKAALPPATRLPSPVEAEPQEFMSLEVAGRRLGLSPQRVAGLARDQGWQRRNIYGKVHLDANAVRNYQTETETPSTPESKQPSGDVADATFPVEDVKLFEEARNLTIDFNKRRTTKAQKKAIVDRVTEIRRELVRRGYDPKLVARVELGESGVPLPATAPPPQADVRPAEGKQPWEMKYQDFYDIAGSEFTAAGRFGLESKNRVPVDPDTRTTYKGAVPEERIHRAVIDKALREGHPVPAAVLADYPDLAAKYGKGEVTKPAQPAMVDLSGMTLHEVANLDRVLSQEEFVNWLRGRPISERARIETAAVREARGGLTKGEVRSGLKSGGAGVRADNRELYEFYLSDRKALGKDVAPKPAAQTAPETYAEKLGREYREREQKAPPFTTKQALKELAGLEVETVLGKSSAPVVGRGVPEEEGRQALLAGKGAKDSPYDKDTQPNEFLAWQSGWWNQAKETPERIPGEVVIPSPTESQVAPEVAAAEGEGAKPSPPKLLQDAIDRFKIEGSKGTDWLWMQASKSDRDAVDQWLVDIKHPITTEPGSQESRIKRVVTEMAKAAEGEITPVAETEAAKPLLGEAATEQHFMKWLEEHVDSDVRPQTESGMRAFVEKFPELIERGDSWSEIRSLAERGGYIKDALLEKPLKKAKPSPGAVGKRGGGGKGVAGFPAPTSTPPDPILSDAGTSHQMPMRLDRPAGETPKTNAPKVIEALVSVVEAAGREVPIRTGGFKGKALGIFKVQPEVIRVRTANDIPVSWHETAHALEKAVFTYPKGGPWKKPRTDTTMQRELVTMGKTLYGERKPSGGYKREGFAEFLRLWGTNPNEAIAQAPTFARWFEKEFLNGLPEVRKALESARAETGKWQEMGSYGRAKASITDPASVRSRAVKLLKTLKDADAWQTAWVDGAHPLDVLVEEAEKRLGRQLNITENPYLLLSAHRKTAPRIVRYMVEKDMTDLAGNVVGRPLSDAAKLVEGQQEDFTVYLWANRALALWNDPKKPEGRNPGLSKEDAEQIVRELDFPRFQQAAQIVYDWSDGVLNYAAQASPTFAEAVKRIRAVDPGYYVPLRREFEELTQAYGRSGVNPKGGSISARLKGSGRRIIDPMQSLIAKADSIVRAAHKRRVLDAILKLSKVEGMGHIIEEVPKDRIPVNVPLQEVIRKAKKELEAMGVEFEDLETDTADIVTFFAPARTPKGGKPIVPIVEGEKVRWYYVDPVLYDTLSGIDVYRLPAVAEWLLGKPASILRAGATGLRASFNLITNPLRDPQTMTLNSQAKANAFKLFGTWMTTMGRAALDVTGIRQDPYFEAFVRMGGEMALPLGTDTAQTRRATRQLFEGKAIKYLDPRNWLDFYRDLIQFPEAATRVAEMREIAKDIGWTPDQLISEEQALTMLLASKRITTDFTAAGKFSEIANRIVPFFNAAIQGPRVTMRRFREEPSRIGLRALALFTIPTLLAWWKLKDEEWYKNMPLREKFLNWHIPAGDELVRIPRAFEPGMLFAALPEVLLDAAYQNNPEEVVEWFRGFVDTVNPVELPPQLGVPFDIARNKQAFFGTPVVSERLKRLPAEEQYDEYTSHVATFLGQKLGWSPKKIDYSIQGFTGGLGRDIAEVFGTGEKEKKFEAADMPVVGRLFSRGGAHPGGGAPAIRELFKVLEQAELRQASKEKPETEQEQTHRLMLTDAGRAVSALLNIRKQTATQNERGALASEAIRIARDAVERTRAGAPRRGGFEEARKETEIRAYLKGTETGRKELTTPQGRQDAVSFLVSLRARGMDAELRKLLRRMQPSAKTDTERMSIIREKYGITKNEWNRRVEAAYRADNARWIEDNPTFDKILTDMESRLKRLSPTDLSQITLDDVSREWSENTAMRKAIREVWIPHGKELRDRDLTPDDLIRIALRRARGGRYKEAAD